MNTSHFFLTVNTQHIMKSGVPPDKVRVLHRLFRIEFHGFTNRIEFHSLVPGLTSTFIETVWVPLKTIQTTIPTICTYKLPGSPPVGMSIRGCSIMAGVLIV